MSRDSCIPKKKNSASKLVLAIAASSELKPGLTVIAGQYSDEQGLIIHTAIVKALVHESSCLPVPMPERENVVCMYSGTARQIEQLGSIRTKLGLLAPEFKHCQFIDRVGSSAFDWSNSAAVSIMLQSKFLKYGGYIFLQQPSGNTPDFRGLQQLNRAAEKHGTRIILFCPGVVCSDQYSCVANEIFEAKPCAPNPGFDEAFIFSFSEPVSSWNLASGKVLCCVRLGDAGLETEITPYVADDLKTRLMAILKADEWSLESIGKTVKINKSNVSRKLRLISATVPKGWNTAMLNQWLEACDLEPIEDDDQVAEDSDCDDQTAESEDYDDEDDLDDLDCIKPVAKASRNERNKRNEIKPKKKQR